jgi:hypothetical protein
VNANAFFAELGKPAKTKQKLQQTAAEFPFTYTYYGFGAAPSELESMPQPTDNPGDKENDNA